MPSRALADYLTAQGLGQPKLWTRGVDTEQFCPRPKLWTHLPRPIHLYVGRLVAEKNVKAFLDTETSGTKLVVGAGPALAGLRQSYPDTTFLGALEGEPLARAYSEADVFVFPSLLDTFGLVVLEALASGVPIAAFPTPHLVEIFGPHEVIAFNDSLAAATRHALDIPSARCRETTRVLPLASTPAGRSPGIRSASLIMRFSTARGR